VAQEVRVTVLREPRGYAQERKNEEALTDGALNLAATGRLARAPDGVRQAAALLDSGTPLPEALPTAIDCSNNQVYKKRLSAAMDGVLAGQGFADPLARTELFPTTTIQMIRVGERTGELSTQLNNAAGFYEEELDYAVDKLTAWFEPITIIFIGGVVGFVALAMVSAMYGIYGQVNLG